MNVRRALAIGGLAASALAVCACAAPDRAPLIDRMAGQGRVRGDRDQVSVEGGRIEALPLAVAHCARYGRAARFSQSADGRSVYACVVQ